jgi:hypothetical protein
MIGTHITERIEFDGVELGIDSTKSKGSFFSASTELQAVERLAFEQRILSSV